MSSLPRSESQTGRLLVVLAAISTVAFIAYKLHDIQEPPAFGHPRWSESYVHWFAFAHVHLGLDVTNGLNVEGITGSGQPIYYLSHPPLAGLLQALIIALFDMEVWAVRILPLICTLLNAALAGLIARRLTDEPTGILTTILFLGMPFTLEYGSSNESYQVFAMTAGLYGYLSYMRFLDEQRFRYWIASLCALSLAMGFTWLGGFMGACVVGHLLCQNIPLQVKFKATGLGAILLGSTALLLLIQQGLATGDYLYPFKRALQRSATPQSISAGITWGALLQLQLTRYFSYFGPITSILTAYWLVRSVGPGRWGKADTFAVTIWLPGIVYGFLLRDVAQQHDFLLLGFGPGAAIMAAFGLRQIACDSSALIGRQSTIPMLLTLLLLGLHAIIAVRSAHSFEAQEARDLKSGAARVPFYLRDLPSNTLLAAAPNARMAVRSDKLDGAEYVSLQPYLDHLVHRPVRAANSSSDILALMCEASAHHRPVALLQTSTSRKHGQIEIPGDWIERQATFDQVHILHMRVPPGNICSESIGKPSP